LTSDVIGAKMAEALPKGPRLTTRDEDRN
jgi:hypothetical protein